MDGHLQPNRRSNEAPDPNEPQDPLSRDPRTPPLSSRNPQTSPHTEDAGALQKAADFVRAFVLGFDVRDAIALLRLDDLYIDTFEVRDGSAARRLFLTCQ